MTTPDIGLREMKRALAALLIDDEMLPVQDLRDVLFLQGRNADRARKACTDDGQFRIIGLNGSAVYRLAETDVDSGIEHAYLLQRSFSDAAPPMGRLVRMLSPQFRLVPIAVEESELATAR